ncbi:MAG TPA: SdrD B-like domain-containing protein, partial [Usitatibacter sp.]|nr:SdrD B-like domain-containing protein [Usitatibacter sp.]
MLVATVANAAAPGTVIQNRSSANASIGTATLTRDSNLVSVTVGTAAPGTVSAVLAATNIVDSQPGATVLLSHTLTNTGSATDVFTLSAVDRNTGWSFAPAAIYPDANGDGQPDGTTPVSGPFTLAPGQVFRFVAKMTVPLTAGTGSSDDYVISATAASGAPVQPVFDRVQLRPNIPLDCGMASKAISKDNGTTPGGPVRITLGFDSCAKPRARLVLTDVIPQGMRYVPGSARYTGTGELVLTDNVAGNDRQGAGGAEIAYDFNVTNAGAVTATVYNLAAHAAGAISFDVEIEPGLALGTVIPNTARYTFYDLGDRYALDGRTNTVTYTVNGRIDFDLTGERIATAQPGSTVTFTNVLVNRGDQPDTYDITLSGSTFPAGTTLALFKSDGVTPLADTNGNNVPDTGLVPAGGRYSIVVKATIPANAAPGAYKVTKTARSASWPARTSSADDAVDAIARRCVATLEPDNSGRVGYGQHVTYAHFLTNRGNCEENLRAAADFLADSRPGWTSAVYLDNPSAGGGSMPGLVDATDTPVKPGWSTVLRPGQTVRLLVDVLAPSADAAAKAKAAIDTDVTTVVISSAESGAVAVRDTTVLDSSQQGGAPQDVIRNFTDPAYGAPTIWAPVGGSLWLRADAPSCNASPQAVDSRTVVITSSNGDREEFTATETGPDTGIFTLPAISVRNGEIFVGDHAIQGRANDVLDIELLGCGRRIETLVTLVDATSTVFDSRTNDPVEGAMVTLMVAQDGQCTRTPAAVSSNPTMTTAKGAFAFPPVASGGEFCVHVKAPNGYRFASQVPWRQLPQGRNLSVTGTASGGSYGQPFRLAPGAMVFFDIPVDAVAQDGLFVQKTASRAVAEIGEFVDYEVKVRNGTGRALDRGALTLADDLPLGFGYVTGSARRDGKPLAEPATGNSRITFTLGALDSDAEATLTYRVRIGPGAMEGDGVNRAQARYALPGASTLSNVASAKVQVSGGVFTDKGFILGKVFMDCNANGEQDAGELGVPGVRLILEDGTYVVTDAGGKFSFYGVSNRTHVVKADRTTLPAGSKLEVISSRNLGDAGSRIVDLKAGELHRADFAIAGCDGAVVEQVRKRAAALARKDDALGALASAKLETDRQPISDPRSLPASGVVNVAMPTITPGAAPNGNGAAASAATVNPLHAGDRSTSAAPVTPAQAGAQPTSAAPVTPAQAGAQPTSAATVTPAQAGAQFHLIDLEKLVPTLDNKLAFINLADGETLPYAQTTVRVKGTAGATFTLTVNGTQVSEKKVGKRAVLQDKQLQAWEYIGIDLVPGENTLVLAQRDPFGNPRGEQTVKVKAPGRLARVAIELPKNAVADGRTPAKVAVRLFDSRDLPVTVRTPVTLEATRGAWDAEDLDPVEPGLQVMVEDGHGEFALMAPIEPGESRIVVTAGPAKAEATLDFLPELRSLIAAGVVEGIINVRKLDAKSLLPARV